MGDVIWTGVATEVALRAGVAVLTLNRPPVNALSHAFRADIAAALHAVTTIGAKGLVLTGAGETFVAGAEISELGQVQPPSLRDLIALLEAMAIPTVAAINGAALGGGLELALGCRVRVAVSGAKLGFPEVHLGILPGAGGTVRGCYLCGASAAADLIAWGRTVGADEALRLGLVDRVVLGDAVGAALAALGDPGLAPAFAAPVPARPRPPFGAAAFEAQSAALLAKARGQAAQRCIAAVRCAATEPFEAAMARERALFVEACASTESLALRHLFVAERQAAKVDGLDLGLARPLTTIGVIGAGTMGRGIAMACADAGLKVHLREVSAPALETGLRAIAEAYAGMAAKGRIPAAEASARAGRITGALEVVALSGCDLVIEAAFEDMSVKRALFAELDAELGTGVILATNTSYLDVNAIADSVRRPERVLGLHFFSPANVMKLLEIVRADKTDAATLATGMALSRRMRKTSVVVGVCRGFVGNRMLQARNAALTPLLLEGARPGDVDAAFRAFGWPMGPLEMQDMAGLDISWRMRKANGLQDAVPDALCEAGRLGQKAGRGWYGYAPGSRVPVPDPEVDRIIAALAEDCRIAPRDIGAAEIIARTHGPLVAEGRRILAEGIAARSSDIDVVWTQGYGFPRHLGGPMFWADEGEGRGLALA